jgi:TldD protein
MSGDIDEAFTSLPLTALTDAGLGRARRMGATHASFRLERVRTALSVTHNGNPRSSRDEVETGLSVSVRHRGRLGFAAASEVTTASAARTAERAMAMAEACAALPGDVPEPASEPVYRHKTWTSDWRVDPFSVPAADRVAILVDWTRRLRHAPAVQQVLAKLVATQENKFYADLAGTVTTQQRIRLHPQLLVAGMDDRTGTSATLRTLGPPTARGLEYMTGDGWDWHRELDELPTHLAEKLRAEPVEPGTYDLVLAPSHLWLTLHESVGHATELDRALGHEMSYAGSTFATLAGLGSLRYGSPLMTVTADRTAEHGLATTGFDDEGVATGSWRLVENGVLTGFQLNRATAALAGAERSNGCAYAESAGHIALQRMPNVSLLPAPDGPGTDELISGVDNGILLAGSDSFSIDPLRENFQFTAQRAYRIHKGRIIGALSGVAYQARTTQFWGSLTALGGEQSYQEFGADLCGKGQPVQAAAVSHGCPSAVFRGIKVLNTGAVPG